VSVISELCSQQHDTNDQAPSWDRIQKVSFPSCSHHLSFSYWRWKFLRKFL